MYITKQKQTHRCRKQTSGQGKVGGQDRGMGLGDTNYYV